MAYKYFLFLVPSPHLGLRCSFLQVPHLLSTQIQWESSEQLSARASMQAGPLLCPMTFQRRRLLHLHHHRPPR
jgi:hypothetical protein